MDQKNRDRRVRPEKPQGERRKFVVTNIPPDTEWRDVRDFFRLKVGEMPFVDVRDTVGLIELSEPESIRKMMSMRNQLVFKGSKLNIKADSLGPERESRNDFGRDRGGQDFPPGNPPMRPAPPGGKYNTYGLSVSFLENLGIDPPLVCNIFVNNIDFKVDSKKLKEVFKLAGKVRNASLISGKDGKSRGFACIRYDHPIEAVQAISMFDKQFLYDRRIGVKMDHENTNQHSKLFKLPEGLAAVGPGLGPRGEPLENVANHVPQSGNSNPQNVPPIDQAPQEDLPVQNQDIMGNAPSGPNHGMGNMMGGFNTAEWNPVNINALQTLTLLQNQLLQQATATGLSLSNLNIPFSGNSVGDLGPTNQLNSSMSGPGNLGGGPNRMNSLPMQNDPNSGFQQQYGGNMGPSRFIDSNQPNNNMMQQMPGMDRQDMHQNSKEKLSDMVIVNNLPPTVTWQMLREKFGECGEVKFAELTGNSTAVVRFQNDWDAQRAVKSFDGIRFDGNTITVRFY